MSPSTQSEISADMSLDDTPSVPRSDDAVRVTGTFIQPWAFTDYTPYKWDVHCSYLKEAGIDTVILQWALTDSNGRVKDVYYPTEMESDIKNDGASFLLNNLLAACQKQDIGVFIGLNSPDEWFSATLENRDWYMAEGALGIAAAREIYNLYGEKYADTIRGWYFSPEYYGGIGHVDEAAEFLNVYLDGLSDISPGLPMMLSPFLRSIYPAALTGLEWQKIFAKTNFRDGDIFCCQDSVGAGGIPLSRLDSYFANLKKAVDTKPGLHFWANNENFTTNGKTAPLDRFVKQLEISSKYVENHVTFAYSHYYAPDIVGTDEWHKAYIQYIQTGEYEQYKSTSSSHEGEKVLVSKDKPYSGTVNTRGDGWDDDGTKLTDGSIPSPDGNTFGYYGSEADNVELVVDLGELYTGLGEFSLHNTFGSWGITSIECVTYYVSDDGNEWQKVGDTVYSYMQTPVDEIDGWTLLDFSLTLNETVSGRYVKAVIENSGWMWISEFSVWQFADAEK